MARRDTARYAEISDPECNKWFRCAWVLPPPLKRKSPSAPMPGQIFTSCLNEVIDSAALTKAQARALAERLFAVEAGTNRAARRRAMVLECAGGAHDREP